MTAKAAAAIDWEGWDAITAARNRAARRRVAEWRASTPERSRAHPPMPFVVGVPRSGTTLLRLMLDAHPELAIPAETHFLPEVFDLETDSRPERNEAELRRAFHELLVGFPTWDQLQVQSEALWRALCEIEPFEVSSALRAFYRLCAEVEGKSRAGDKTPTYLDDLPVIEALLPEAHFVHLVRDGRDVCLSALEAPPAVARLWFPRGLDVRSLAEQWRRRIKACHRQAATALHFTEIRFEDLLAHPKRELKRLCAFLRLSYEPAMERPHERVRERVLAVARPPEEWGISAQSGEPGEPDQGDANPPRWDPSRIERSLDATRAQRWRRQMRPADVAAFEEVAGDVLAACGYELATGPRRRRR